MLHRIGRKLAIGVTLIALVTPAAFATPLGTDPEPWVANSVLAFFGVA